MWRSKVPDESISSVKRRGESKGFIFVSEGGCDMKKLEQRVI